MPRRSGPLAGRADDLTAKLALADLVRGYTLGGATQLRLADRIGTIEAGKLAALAIACGSGDSGGTTSVSPSAGASEAAAAASPSPSWSPAMSPAPIPVVRPGQQPPPFSDLEAMFAYDATEPLQYEDIGEDDWIHMNVPGEHSAHEITFASAGRTVHGYLVTPMGDGPFPVILYGIDRPLDWDFAYKNAAALAGTGTAGLVVDAPASLDLPGYYTWDADQDIRTWVARVTDLRRGLDLLATLPQIDAGRIGFQGCNYGGRWAPSSQASTTA